MAHLPSIKLAPSPLPCDLATTHREAEPVAAARPHFLHPDAIDAHLAPTPPLRPPAAAAPTPVPNRPPPRHPTTPDPEGRGAAAALRAGGGTAADVATSGKAWTMERTTAFVEQVGGAACHTGHRSCFFRKREGGGFVVVGKKVFDPEDVYK